MTTAQPDWSKAPHDATQYCPEEGGYSAHWIKEGHFCVVGFEVYGWQEEVDKKAPEEILISRPTCSTTPPVGTRVLYKNRDSLDTAYDAPEEAEVHAVDGEWAAISVGVARMWVHIGTLSPIVTPEMRREQAIQSVRDKINWQAPQFGPCPVAQLYDLGMLTQEPVQ